MPFTEPIREHRHYAVVCFTLLHLFPKGNGSNYIIQICFHVLTVYLSTLIFFVDNWCILADPFLILLFKLTKKNILRLQICNYICTASNFFKQSLHERYLYPHKGQVSIQY